MKTELTKITPALAAKWLESVPDFQRKIDDRQVKKLVLALERNEWRENGATIVFNSEGQLIDGQHRLTAIVQSGRSVYSLIVRNVPSGEATFHTIGDEKPRKVTDFLRCSNVTATAAAMRYYWLVKNNVWPVTSVVIPHADVLKLSRNWADYISGLVKPLAPAGRMTGQTSFIVFLVFYYTKIQPVDEARLAAFFARVGDGVELHQSDPAFQLRRHFLSLQRGQKTHPLRAKALIVKALNLHLDGKPCGQLRWDIDREEFPPLYGYARPKSDIKNVASEAQQNART